MSKQNPKNKAEAYSYKFEELSQKLRSMALLNNEVGILAINDQIRQLTFSLNLELIDIKFTDDK